MLRKLRERMSDERGFTLIELLVVILIIAILAAIAIPFFLNQRERSYVSQTESALKNAATAMESYATANGGDYPDVGQEAQLTANGYRATNGVTVTIGTSGAGNYCLSANHTELSPALDGVYRNSDGAPDTSAPVACA